MECKKCGKKFENSEAASHHVLQQCRPKTCPSCSQTFARSSDLFKHMKKQKKITCDHCNKAFCNYNEYQKHQRSIRKNTDDSIPDLDQRIYPETGYEDEEKYLEVIDHKFNDIQDLWKKYKHYQIINKQIDPSFTYREINDFLVDFYTNHANSFKINLGLGYLLYHTITNAYKYFYVSRNNLLLDKAVPIINRKDISDLMKHIVDMDLPTNFYLKKPSSGWILAGLTNIQYTVTEMKNVPIGNPDEQSVSTH